ncbi:cysteine desulfurase-like protein [Mesorhizobium sp.]|jgi:cysteine desulfurase family protein (TIGR01976 family)|uniref:cysteine desulfurase-like protein n=1 Tax=Mesorhizobium sp. TaxID=1871066 RepID=UPI00356646C6
MDIDTVRDSFPAMAKGAKPANWIFFDNPAGTQMAGRSIERMTRAMIDTNANLGGYFETSVAAQAMVDDAHQAMADFLNAADRREVIFGQNMTTLTFAMSRAIGRDLKAGDAIVLTRMDHDANVAPWLMLAEDRGLEVRWIDLDPKTFELDLSTLEVTIDDKVKLVAVGYASNVTGTINDVKRIAQRARAVGALSYIDAVQFAPHRVIDVQDLGCDFLVCSAYKFFGPHHGVLWGRIDLLQALTAYKVRAASNTPPGKFETGTTSREALAGVLGAVEHYAWLGQSFGNIHPDATRRERIVAGIEVADRYERGLTARLIAGLSKIDGVTIQGIVDPGAQARRVPTVSVTIDGVDPADVARAMAKEGIFLWHGHNYGLEPIRRLGLAERNGVVRIGLAHYNTEAEVDFLLATLTKWLNSRT